MKKYISNLLSANPLCGIDTYNDTLNLQSGLLSRRIKKYTFTGNETISNCVATTDGQNYCAVFRFDDIGMTDIIDYEETMANISYPQYISSHFTNKTANYNDYKAISNGQIGANDYGSTGQAKNRYIIFCVAGLTTAADYSAWFAQQYANGMPVEVYYILETPTTTTITTPTGLTGTVNGYLTQTDTPTPTVPIYPIANPVTMWANYTPNIYNSGWTTASGQPEKYNGGWS